MEGYAGQRNADGYQEGEGKQFFVDGSTYVGQFKAGKIAGKLAGKLAGILTRKAKASERMKRQATSLYASKPTGLENPPVFHIDGVAQRLFLKRGEEVRAARSNRHLQKSVPHTPYVASPLCVPLRRRRC